MTQKEKDLLLKDLCARLPYGVKLHIPSFSDTPQLLQQISDYETVEINDYTSPVGVGEVKPYLRPMSSMTEEEKIIHQSKQTIIFDFKNNKLYVDNYYSLDYLNSIHVDYRGLIEKGLALEAPEDMYKIKE